MKTKSILLFFITIISFSFIADELPQKLNGVFQQKRNKYGNAKDWENTENQKIIKVFKDGYWLGAFYDDTRPAKKLFNGVCGGTYQLKDGKYLEKVAFYSWDSTAVGNVFAFNYQIDTKNFKQFGMMNSEKYKNYPINEESERIVTNEPLKNDALEGVWFMESGYWGGKTRFGEGVYKGSKVVKIFCYPIVVYAYYQPRTKRFQGAGGAFYQFDGKTLTETNEFYSWDAAKKGQTERFQIALINGKLQQESADWANMKEIYGKATH